MKLAKRLMLGCLVVAVAGPTVFAQGKTDPGGLLQGNDRIVFMGGTFAERAGLYGYLETALLSRFPQHKLTFRNLGYSADTAASLLADITHGDTETNRGSNRALNFGTMHKHLSDAKTDVIFLCLGMADSFAGQAGLKQFEKDLGDLIDAYRAKNYNGKTPPRIALVGPIPHENLRGNFPDPTEHNRDVLAYRDAMMKVAVVKKTPMVDLFDRTQAIMGELDKGIREQGPGKALTINGIHLDQGGYQHIAAIFLAGLCDAAPPLQVALKLNQTVAVTPQHLTMPGVAWQFQPRLQGPKDLDPTKDYTLIIDGQVCTKASGAAWAKGVTLQESPLHNVTEKIRLTIVDQYQEWFYKWRAVNGEYVYGRRARPFGVLNFPGEMAKLDEMCHQLDGKIHELLLPTKHTFLLIPSAQTSKFKPLENVVSAKTRPLIEKVYGQKQGIIGGKEVATAKDPEEARKLFQVQEGYEINLFASEKDFPLHDPVAMAWDAKGRLWVATMPSYPHYLPGVPPDDKILILEDTDADGKADKCTVFADGLYLPTGLELGDGGVYLAAQPNLLFLKDTDGDDKADVREVILHGFGSGDSHHAIHAFTWTPEGALLMHEGIFHRSNVETPHGVVRQRDAGIYRFQPKNHKLETYVSYNFANPWGHVFDKWGFNFIADASGGANYNAVPITGYKPFPEQHPGMKVFTSVVRPTCGCELISSRHFPEKAQGNFVVNNNIGFQGIKQHQPYEEGSGYHSKELAPLLFSKDPSFRPVAIKHGPDGALYIVDWFNPLVGHMQHSLRDPGRDHYHGRIWRITAKNRDLVQRPRIAGESIAKLLDLLKEPENLTRYVARAELRERHPKEVATGVKTWIKSLKESDLGYEHQLLEALWVLQGADQVDADLLVRLLRGKDEHVRAGATRALRYLNQETQQLLAEQINDVHPRVRLEAAVALSFARNAQAAEVALEALKHPRDYYLDYGLKETIDALEPHWKPAILAGKPFAEKNAAGLAYVLASMNAPELLKLPPSAAVYQTLLTRPNTASEHRMEAVKGLASLKKTSLASELLALLDQLDQSKHDPANHVLHDLGLLLTKLPRKDLQESAQELEKMVVAARQPATQQFACAAMIIAQEKFPPKIHPETKLHLVIEGLALVPDAALRQESYSQLRRLAENLVRHDTPPGANKGKTQIEKMFLESSRPLIHALATTPGKEKEAFALLADWYAAGRERTAIIQALGRMPRSTIPGKEAERLVQQIAANVGKLPPAQRTEPEALDALQLANQLAARLPKEQAAQVRKLLDEVGVQIVTLRAVPHLLLFDRTKFYVEAGKPAVVIFDNTDIMPHNLVISQPGSLVEIGTAGDQMTNDPQAHAKHFVPSNKKVLHATKLLQPREVGRLQFIAPEKPGDYVFVCTFPGHWRVMNGVMKVVPKLADVPPEELNAPTREVVVDNRPFVRNWTVEELTPELINMDSNRNFARGQKLFQAASCVQCHKFKGEGGALGPDLTDLHKKITELKLNKIGLLREVLEPSKVLESKFQPWTIVTTRGEIFSGMIVYEDKKILRVQGGPQDPPHEIKIADIEEKAQSKISLMPTGLLVTLEKEEIFDLLAYIAFGGDPNHRAFRRKE